MKTSFSRRMHRMIPPCCMPQPQNMRHRDTDSSLK
ncbi:hypothetical protein EVA_10704 [gut metagenome]|uniref:Uncharacterized protein n=1 Tax=gut metagenome TaxID=749906 RepID=J9GH63_9ZZZZ